MWSPHGVYWSPVDSTWTPWGMVKYCAPGASSTSPFSSALAAAMYALQPPMLVLPSVSDAGGGATQSEGAKHPSCDAATAPALTSRNLIVMRADFARETSKPNRPSHPLLQTSLALTRHAALTAENVIQQRPQVSVLVPPLQSPVDQREICRGTCASSSRSDQL